MRTGVTAQADKAVGQDAALQRGVKFVNDIRGEACGGRSGCEGGQKGFEMLGNDLVEDGLARIAWHIRGCEASRHDAMMVSEDPEGSLQL